MQDFKRILAVTWMTKYCQSTISLAVSMAERYDAELSVIHIIDSFWLQGWNLHMMLIEEEHRKDIGKIKVKLDSMIDSYKKRGVKVNTIVKEGDISKVILELVEQEKVEWSSCASMKKVVSNTLWSAAATIQ